MNLPTSYDLSALLDSPEPFIAWLRVRATDRKEVGVTRSQERCPLATFLRASFLQRDFPPLRVFVSGLRIRIVDADDDPYLPRHAIEYLVPANHWTERFVCDIDALGRWSRSLGAGRSVSADRCLDSLLRVPGVAMQQSPATDAS